MVVLATVNDVVFGLFFFQIYCLADHTHERDALSQYFGDKLAIVVGSVCDFALYAALSALVGLN